MAQETAQPGIANISTSVSSTISSARWYALALFTLAYGMNNLDKLIISVVIAPLKAEFGLTDLQISLLSGLAVTLPFALVCIPMGMLADRVSRKWLLVAIMSCWSVATLGAGFATTVAAVFVARVCVGSFEAGFSPVTMALIADLFPSRERSTALGLFALGGALGVFLAMALGSIVVAEYGWRTAFFIAGMPGLVLAMIIALSVREPGKAAPELAAERLAAAHAPSLAATFRYLVKDKVLLNVFVGMVLSTAMMAALAIWLPTFFLRVYALDSRHAGLFAALIVGGAGALGAALGGVFADRFAGRGSRKLLMVSATTVAAAVCALLGLLLHNSVMTAVVLLGLCAFFAQAIFGTGYGLIVSQSPANMRATVLSTLFVCFNVLSYGTGALVVGLISDRLAIATGPRSIAYGIAAMALISLWATLHLLLAYRPLRRRERAAS